jgi:serpin B
MRTTFAAFLAAAMLVVAAPGVRAQPPAASLDDKAAVAKGNNQFALDLYRQLRGQPGNLFFSPYSISAALTMTYAGARGDTARQMESTLHFTLGQERLHPAFGAVINDLNDPVDRPYDLHVANGLWLQQGYGILPDFLRVVTKDYNAGLQEVDFVTAAEAARKTINEWVEKKTNERIKDLLPAGAVDRLTRLILCNAIYFKAAWQMPFEKEGTRELAFTVNATRKVNVPMMAQTGSFGYLETDTFQALAMPYQNEALSMVVFLPKKPDGLADLEKTLTLQNLESWLGSMLHALGSVIFPRFKVTTQCALNDVLMEMGMTAAFTPKADFSGISGVPDLHISAVVHKAFVNVNEQGTEAAAATGVVLRVAGMPMPKFTFRADRPFVFLIRHNKTGSILFLGRLTDPQG